MLLTCVSLGSAQAQDAANTSKADESDTDIVVTATRRSESVSSVPLSVSVLSPQALSAGGARNLGDYLYTVPGVNYSKDGRDGRGDITIRGVTTGNLSVPMVGTYVDDVPIGLSNRFSDSVSGYDQRLLDLERIEILKGPQGTLYGASAMGGVLRYITVTPKLDTFSGTAGVDLSTTRNGALNSTANGILNVPLAPKAAVRVSGFYSRDGGYIDAQGLATGKRVNSSDTYGARATLLYQATEGFSVKAAAQYQKSSQDGTGYVDYDLATGKPLYGDLIHGNLYTPEPSRTENQLYTVTLAYDLGFATISSITGYQRQYYQARRDFSFIYTFFGPFLGPLPGKIVQAEDSRSSLQRKWTQEVRLVSASGGTLEWIVGGFFTSEKSVLLETITQTYDNGARPSPLLYGPDGGFFNSFKEVAGYATVNLNVTKKFVLTGGVRVAHQSQNILQVNGGILAPGAADSRTTSETPVTFLAAAKYELTPRSNVYARVASGYRAGGPNLGFVDPVTGQLVADAPVFQSDKLISYELGYKAKYGNGLLNVDAAIYQIDWSNIQQVIFINGGSAVSNFGKARIRGAELAVNVRPADGFRLGGTVSFIDPKLKTDSPVGLQALAGARLPNSAKLSGSVMARYQFSVRGGIPASIQIDHAVVGERNAGFDRASTPSPSIPNLRIPAFGQTDVQASIEVSRVKIGVYVRNLFDRRGLLSADTSQSPFGGSTYSTPIRPRTGGVNATMTF